MDGTELAHAADLERPLPGGHPEEIREPASGARAAERDGAAGQGRDVTRPASRDRGLLFELLACEGRRWEGKLRLWLSRAGRGVILFFSLEASNCTILQITATVLLTE